ncbi:MAG: YopX family protein [Roseburia sp.]|nr:YopX family protein [Roseburia sp.]MCI7322806.1 YopX family protein [Lachnospiraceae bacterium]
MREILFKAKRIDNGEWVEGYYLSKYDLLEKEVHFIFSADKHNTWICAEIDPETLCQFTGLCDKNVNRIWENDIVNYNGKYASIKFGMYCSSSGYGNYNLGFYVDFPGETLYRKELGYWHEKVEVVGNIFDNPELLQEDTE